MNIYQIVLPTPMFATFEVNGTELRLDSGKKMVVNGNNIVAIVPDDALVYLLKVIPEPNHSRELEFKELVETIEKVVRGTWEELAERVKTLEEFCMMRSK